VAYFLFGALMQWPGLPIRHILGRFTLITFAVPQDARSYTTVEVAKRLGVSLQTVQRWVDAGHLKAWKTLGGHRRIESESAERLFKAHQERIGTAPQAGAQGVAQDSPMTVLIVDDNLMDRELMAWMVRKALPDAQVELAESGFQALVIVGRSEPQVIITDINMPKLDGLEMIPRRSAGSPDRTRRVFSTDTKSAHMNGLERIRGLAAGCPNRTRRVVAVSALSRQSVAEIGTLPPNVYFLAKPIDENRLIAAMLGRD